jgi:hypothetical protein
MPEEFRCASSVHPFGEALARDPAVDLTLDLLGTDLRAGRIAPAVIPTAACWTALRCSPNASPASHLVVDPAAWMEVHHPGAGERGKERRAGETQGPDRRLANGFRLRACCVGAGRWLDQCIHPAFAEGFFDGSPCQARGDSGNSCTRLHNDARKCARPRLGCSSL